MLSRSDNLRRHMRLVHTNTDQSVNMAGNGLEGPRIANESTFYDEDHFVPIPAFKKDILEDGSDDSSDSDSSVSSEDPESCDELPTMPTHMKGVCDINIPVFTQKREYFEEQGLDTRAAKKKANEYMLDYNRRDFWTRYRNLLELIYGFKMSKVHRAIMKSIKTYRSIGIGIFEAFRKAIRDREYSMDKYMTGYETGEEEDDEEEEEEELQ